MPLLHIDDSENERFLVQRAISATQTWFTYYEADGVDSAIPYFQFHGHDGEPKQFPCPAVVLLDYDLGKHTGADLLYWLRLTKKISSIPVVMFSGSVGNGCVAECYAAGANYFLGKPKNLARLGIIVRALHLGLVSLHRPWPIQRLQEYQPDEREQPVMAMPA